MGTRCFAYAISFNLIFTKCNEVGIIIINSQKGRVPRIFLPPWRQRLDHLLNYNIASVQHRPWHTADARELSAE